MRASDKAHEVKSSPNLIFVRCSRRGKKRSESRRRCIFSGFSRGRDVAPDSLSGHKFSFEPRRGRVMLGWPEVVILVATFSRDLVMYYFTV